LAGAVELEPFVGDGRPGDIAAELLQFHALIGAPASDRIIKINGALGERPGFCQSFIPESAGEGLSVGEHQINLSGFTPVFTIDQFNLNPDLIALDVEGYELSALRGAVETIQRCRPTIICKQYAEVVTGFLEGLGYRKVSKSWHDLIYVFGGEK
jgi:Methyltransferase FkbM domain